MANTYTLISSVTVGVGGAASMAFTSIPSTYTDLVVKLSTRDSDLSANNGYVLMTFNGSTSSYSTRWIRGNGAAASSATGATSSIDVGVGGAMDSGGNTASTFSNIDVYIPNYAGSAYKSTYNDSVSESNATTAYMGLEAGLWSNTAAITSISFAPTVLFAQYSTAYLYGVNNA